jgi:hypothetical protein
MATAHADDDRAIFNGPWERADSSDRCGAERREAALFMIIANQLDDFASASMPCVDYPRISSLSFRNVSALSISKVGLYLSMVRNMCTFCPYKRKFNPKFTIFGLTNWS